MNNPSARTSENCVPGPRRNQGNFITVKALGFFNKTRSCESHQTSGIT